MQDGRKAVWNIPYVSVASFPSLKQNFIAYHFSSCPDCIFEIHQLWQSGFSRVYSSCCCSCSFEPEIMKIVQSSHKMYSNNILNFQESIPILNACTKKVWKLIESTIYIYIYIYIYTYIQGSFKKCLISFRFNICRAPLKIRTEMWISFSSLIRSDIALLQQKRSAKSLLSGWSLELFERVLYIDRSLPLYDGLTTVSQKRSQNVFQYSTQYRTYVSVCIVFS